MKNRFNNFSIKNVEEIIRKYSAAKTVQMVIHPSLAYEAQGKLIENSCFFCNIGRIYTGYYNGIKEDFNNEGLGRGTIIIKGDILKIYRDFMIDINEKRFNFLRKAEKFYEIKPFNFFLRKIRGIIKYAVLKNHFKFLEELYKENMDIGLKIASTITKKDLELLRVIPIAYFIFLFKPGNKITISQLSDSLSRYPELKYFRKLETKRRKEIAQKAAKYLYRRGFIKMESKDKWYADDIESPYPSSRDPLDSIKVIEINSLFHTTTGN